MRVTAKSRGGLQVEIEAAGHDLIADEPLEHGGDDAGPNPYGLLLSALGSCKVMTSHMYAERKGWPLEAVHVSLSTHQIHAKDCEDCDSNPEAKVDIIEVEIEFVGPLDEEQQARLREISDRCPLHRTLTSETKIRTSLAAT